jgi:alpha-tubulin suppressor-like RCC1 family protein
VADDDASACGASCQACTAPTNATALCVSGACVSECAPGWLKCDSGCCRATAVSVGDAVACALLTTGGVRCWGNNQQYQVGNNSSQNASTPQQVVGLTSGVASVSAGFSHVCALTTSGGAKCWGQGSRGELGNGNTNGASQPVDVQGLTSGVAQVVAAASSYSCALTTTGTVKCWGDNTYGVFGDGTTTNSLVPVDVPGLPSVAEVRPGTYHVCVRTTAGAVKCWGNNYKGQLGNGTTTSSLTPVDVTGLSSGVVALSSGGNFSCALLSTGTVKCWGSNLSYELGNGTTTSSSVPVTVNGLSSVVAISCGRLRSCAMTTAGGLKCWGSSATDVAGLTSGVTAFSAGDGTYCAVSGPGEVRCWGSNASGALGDGSTVTGRTAPGLVSGR